MKIRISLKDVTKLNEDKFQQGYVEVDFGNWLPLSRLIKDEKFLKEFLEAQVRAVLSPAIRCFVLAHQADEECVGMPGFDLTKGFASVLLGDIEALEKKVGRSIVNLVS